MSSVKTETETEQKRRSIVNFSRPRMLGGGSNSFTRPLLDQKTGTGGDEDDGFTFDAHDGGPNPTTTKAIHAFRTPSPSPSRSPSDQLRPFPDEPRFSLDTDPGRTSRSRGAPLSHREQRHPVPPANLQPIRSILKHTSIEQTSSRASSRASSNDAGESLRSHHTTSEAGGAQGEAGGENWTSSRFDTSTLSEKEVQKLRKKGINPALYLEMQSARRKGKSCVGGLTGNAYMDQMGERRSLGTPCSMKGTVWMSLSWHGRRNFPEEA